MRYGNNKQDVLSKFIDHIIIGENCWEGPFWFINFDKGQMLAACVNKLVLIQQIA